MDTMIACKFETTEVNGKISDEKLDYWGKTNYSPCNHDSYQIMENPETQTSSQLQVTGQCPKDNYSWSVNRTKKGQSNTLSTLKTWVLNLGKQNLLFNGYFH